MIAGKNLKTKTLLCLGVTALALRAVLQTVVDRRGLSNDTSDFAFGVLFGIGLGLMIIVAWRIGRMGRSPRSRSTGA